MKFQPSTTRYDSMVYRRSGKSGIRLPALSLGLWHNFGGVDVFENSRAMIRRAFDLGITHFDLANNYGPPPGSAEKTFGEILKKDLHPFRDELIVSNKAGWGMWPGPYGDWGSRKYLVASLDQSLKRMGLDYVDIFYHHRPDPETPVEESMGALDFIVRSGRALYAGISSYGPEDTRKAARILRALGTPCLIHQPKYSMFNRWIEDGLIEALEAEGMGCIVFSPLAQGLLTDRYLAGVPEPQQATLEQLRSTLAALLPEAEQGIAYGVPCFKEAGKGVAGFGFYKNHCTYFPMSGSITTELADDLTGFVTAKGSIRFPTDEPLSAGLVERLVDARRREIARSGKGG